MKVQALSTGSTLERRSALAGMAALMLPACFDVEQVDIAEATAGAGPTMETTPLLIDDFDDGDSLPTSNLFGPWGCDAYSGGVATCNVASEGFNGSGYALQFELVDAPNGELDYPGVFLFALRTVVRVDLTLFETVVFRAKIELEEAAEQTSELLVNISLGCSDVSDSPADIGGFQLQSAVPIGPTWQIASLPIALFVQPVWQTPRIDEHACRTLVDHIFIEVSPADLEDGRAVSGTLTVDDVRLL